MSVHLTSTMLFLLGAMGESQGSERYQRSVITPEECTGGSTFEISLKVKPAGHFSLSIPAGTCCVKTNAGPII